LCRRKCGRYTQFGSPSGILLVPFCAHTTRRRRRVVGAAMRILPIVNNFHRKSIVSWYQRTTMPSTLGVTMTLFGDLFWAMPFPFRLPCLASPTWSASIQFAHMCPCIHLCVSSCGWFVADPFCDHSCRERGCNVLGLDPTPLRSLTAGSLYCAGVQLFGYHVSWFPFPCVQWCR
jgi:hypothetical protein